MDAINVFLIDANKLFREGMKRLFEGTSFNVVGEAGTLREGLSTLGTGKNPDLILIDLPSGADEEVDAMRSLRENHPSIRIVILTNDLETRRLSAALGAGAGGYLLKDIACEALMQSLKLVMMGEKVFPTHLAELLVSGRTEDMGAELPTRRKGLSQREVQILRCLLNGNSNKMIANHLNITEATVKVHLKSLLRKINASNRTQAAIWALNNGIGDQAAETGVAATV
ncbi:two-component system nitrate/nitrite response regulator NarL [Azospirillum lipoferum]|uniref:Response regulator transcription factor n=1 Tax=Azospirillum lipoferum TaxID=193 RepID=A0A5A9GVB4_AZOLI|nr:MULTISPECIES: response regulator transcription factor [Azospirillum]KAA0598421.1 response regulator transcription factor [Azospirillum lipoferum]MCP1609584.1 two-component system nitrate/nitrite response regulator NarL [Azospirillum lipoferum]MDW5535107.1 response regulator transcription factor [Azospirillum sp. NL1]